MPSCSAGRRTTSGPRSGPPPRMSRRRSAPISRASRSTWSRRRCANRTGRTPSSSAAISRRRSGGIKDGGDGNLLVYGSADLVGGLLELDLVDELRILLFPVILGSGKRLFRDETELRRLRLLSTAVTSSGVVILTYERQAGPAGARRGRLGVHVDRRAGGVVSRRRGRRPGPGDGPRSRTSWTRRGARRRLGDREWRRRARSARRGGPRRGQALGRRTWSKSTGDGILARFDGPTRALRCGLALCCGARRLGIEIRAAIHTGEIEVRGDDIGGIAVHIASRVLSSAETGRSS